MNPTDDDIRQTTLRRRPAGTATWTVLGTFTRANTPTTFTDTTMAARTLYEYDLLVEDAAGNQAQAYQPLVLRSADELIRIRFTDVVAVFDADKQQVVLCYRGRPTDSTPSTHSSCSANTPAKNYRPGKWWTRRSQLA